VIAGIDPGRRQSGFVLVRTLPALGIVSGGRTKNDRVCDQLWELNLEAIVMENYRLYPWMAKTMIWNDLLEVRMIGRIQEIARRRGIKLVEITPSQGKRIKDRDLKALGTWSHCNHTMDAFRVFWTFWLKGGGDGGDSRSKNQSRRRRRSSVDRRR